MLSDLFLIRHGQPIHNPAIRYDLPPGPDLSERGRAEARQAAAFLADKGIEQLLVSPFARTTQTAEVLVDALGLPARLPPSCKSTRRTSRSNTCATVSVSYWPV